MNTNQTLVYAVTDLTFYFDAGERDMPGADGSLRHHGTPGTNSPWFSDLPVIGEIRYHGNLLNGWVVWNEHSDRPWYGDLGNNNPSLSIKDRAAFLREHLGFREFGGVYGMMLGLNFRDVPLEYDKVTCYHGSGLFHMAWGFRSQNTSHSFRDMRFNESPTHKLIKIHSQLVRVDG